MLDREKLGGMIDSLRVNLDPSRIAEQSKAAALRMNPLAKWFGKNIPADAGLEPLVLDGGKVVYFDPDGTFAVRPQVVSGGVANANGTITIAANTECILRFGGPNSNLGRTMPIYDFEIQVLSVGAAAWTTAVKVPLVVTRCSRENQKTNILPQEMSPGGGFPVGRFIRNAVFPVQTKETTQPLGIASNNSAMLLGLFNTDAADNIVICVGAVTSQE